MRGRVGVLCAAWTGLALCAGCAQQDDLGAMGRAVAAAVDTTNGHPVLILKGYPSWSDKAADDPDAAALAAGFAAELGIPDAAENQFQSPRCGWAPSAAGTRRELWAQFSPPVARGDSTVVDLSTGCAVNDNEAFEQVHTFVLMKSETGEWQVVARRLTMIT